MDEDKKNDDKCDESELLSIIAGSLDYEHLDDAFDGSEAHTQQLSNKRNFAPKLARRRLVSSRAKLTLGYR